MKDDVLYFIIEALTNLHYDPNAVTPETTLGPFGLDLDSLALAELLVRIDNGFGYRFADDDAERVATLTVDEIATEVAAHVASGQVPS